MLPLDLICIHDTAAPDCYNENRPVRHPVFFRPDAAAGLYSQAILFFSAEKSPSEGQEIVVPAGAAVQIGFFIPGQIKGQDVIVVSVLLPVPVFIVLLHFHFG